MEESLTCIKHAPLFAGMEEEEIYTLLKCCGVQEGLFRDGETVFFTGEKPEQIFLVLDGKVCGYRENFLKQKDFLFRLETGEVFGGSFAGQSARPLTFDVICEGECRLLFLDYQRIFTFCSLACPFHTRFMENLFSQVCKETAEIAEKLEHRLKKTTREKLISYLSLEAVLQKNYEIEIPMNRQELADYLGVDRSAMSSELGKMKAEGILDFKKNRFLLFPPSH